MTPLPWYDCVSDCGVHTPAGLNNIQTLFLDSTINGIVLLDLVACTSLLYCLSGSALSNTCILLLCMTGVMLCKNGVPVCRCLIRALSDMTVVQDLDVSGCAMLSTGGLQAIAALTQLTALHGRSMMLCPETSSHRMLSATNLGVLNLLCSLTGDTPR